MIPIRTNNARVSHQKAIPLEKSETTISVDEDTTIADHTIVSRHAVGRLPWSRADTAANETAAIIATVSKINPRVENSCGGDFTCKRRRKSANKHPEVSIR